MSSFSSARVAGDLDDLHAVLESERRDRVAEMFAVAMNITFDRSYGISR